MSERTQPTIESMAATVELARLTILMGMDELRRAQTIPQFRGAITHDLYTIRMFSTLCADTLCGGVRWQAVRLGCGVCAGDGRDAPPIQTGGWFGLDFPH